ncbi:hypothetical protein DFAR_630047 [Desulfarculales bacterium]
MPHYHKLRLAVSGCSNGCSRPQIADLALVGLVCPEFHLDHCLGWGVCARGCPDQAIAMIDDRTPRIKRPARNAWSVKKLALRKVLSPSTRRCVC